MSLRFAGTFSFHCFHYFHNLFWWLIKYTQTQTQTEWNREREKVNGWEQRRQSGNRVTLQFMWVSNLIKEPPFENRIDSYLLLFLATYLAVSTSLSLFHFRFNRKPTNRIEIELKYKCNEQERVTNTSTHIYKHIHEKGRPFVLLAAQKRKKKNIIDIE